MRRRPPRSKRTATRLPYTTHFRSARRKPRGGRRNNMSKSCLVVDDSKVIRKVARHILESMAFAVEEAADGQEALTFCRATRPDVILLDWNMPVMSGMEFLGAFNDLDSWRAARPASALCTTANSKRGKASGRDKEGQ